jgi:concanavalin A-like lectin/glucanase superfamily protein
MRHAHLHVLCIVFAIASVRGSAAWAQENGPVASWTFDSSNSRTVSNVASNTTDEIHGNFSVAEGVSGRALEFDGYTTVVVRKAAAAPRLTDAVTVEAWIAVAAYPWNTLPIVDQSDEQMRGYSFTLGPRGELALKVATDGRWLAASSPEYAVPLRKWVHVAGRYERANGVTLYINGQESGRAPLPQSSASGARALSGRITAAQNLDVLIGGVRAPERASNWHRYLGTRPSWYSLDGLIDEVKIYDVALPPAAIRDAYVNAKPAPDPPLPARVFPSGPPGPGRFGAYYTELKYYPAWDALWRTGPDADIVVRFDESAARVVFWRGTQYSPAWVTDNNLWMSDQSVEGFNADYTYEHMNDKQNRYSHVSIVEQSDARVVVHWRYALVNVNNEFWNVTPRLENGAWIDEYYYFYPDATGIRKVTWKHGTLGRPIQLQESIVLAQPGQVGSDVINAEYATVGNLRGETQLLTHVQTTASLPNDIVEPAPGTTTKPFPADLTIQMHNFKSQYKPFLIFEPGSTMQPRYLRDLDIRALSLPGRNGHWPVAQILSDGRTSQAADRASHLVGFPISNPPVHEGKDGRDYWNGLYGMTNRPFKDVVTLARSWEAPPRLSVIGGGFTGGDYDRSERAYKLAAPGSGTGQRLQVTVAASETSPVHNVVLVITNWGDADATLTMDGRPVPRGQQFRYGMRNTLEGTDLIVWIKTDAIRPVTITLTPKR